MMYKKVICDGYILGVGTVDHDGNIDSAEYNRLSSIIEEMPTAPTGYYYGLRADTLAWELVEVPVEEEDPTADEVLDIIFGGDEA